MMNISGSKKLNFLKKIMLSQMASVSNKILLGLFLSSLSVVPVKAEPLINPEQQLGRVCAVVASKEAVIKNYRNPNG